MRRRAGSCSPAACEDPGRRGRLRHPSASAGTLDSWPPAGGAPAASCSVRTPSRALCPEGPPVRARGQGPSACPAESALGSSPVFRGTASQSACCLHSGTGLGSEMPLGLQSSPDGQGPTCSVTSVPRALKPLGEADDPVRTGLMPLDWRDLGRVQRPAALRRTRVCVRTHAEVSPTFAFLRDDLISRPSRIRHYWDACGVREGERHPGPPGRRQEPAVTLSERVWGREGRADEPRVRDASGSPVGQRRRSEGEMCGGLHPAPRPICRRRRRGYWLPGLQRSPFLLL